MRKKVTVALALLLLATAAAVGQTPASKKPSTPAPSKKPPPVHSSVTVSAGVSNDLVEKEGLLRKTLKSAGEAYSRKEYEPALKQYLAAVRLADELGKDGLSLQQEALGKTGHCFMMLQRYAEAEAAYLKTAEIQTKWAGPYESSIGHSYLNAATVQAALQDWEKAGKYARRAIEKYGECIQHFKHSDEYDVSDIVANAIRGDKVTGLKYLGLIYRNQGKSEEALIAWEEGFTLGEKFHAKPAHLLEIASLAVDLQGELGHTSERDVWLKRYERVTAQASKPTP